MKQPSKTPVFLLSLLFLLSFGPTRGQVFTDSLLLEEGHLQWEIDSVLHFYFDSSQAIFPGAGSGLLFFVGFSAIIIQQLSKFNPYLSGRHHPGNSRILPGIGLPLQKESEGSTNGSKSPQQGTFKDQYCLWTICASGISSVPGT